MSWAEIKYAVNSTLGDNTIPLDLIINYASYNNFYNTIESYITAFGDNSGTIMVIPFNETISGLQGRKMEKVVLPPNAKTIAGSAFAQCSTLTSITFNPQLSTILNYAFDSCTGLTKIVLPSSITQMASEVFRGCNKITDIYVPWSNGKVANAPWGATNATVHYDTKI